ncbi:MAG TPA: sigma-70 family RNA polymerase sigma factor [Microbacteriaceae bacterium]|nr:sigma-70 family RNA polymerase sigma factor [Microbacteriaceae bacterium]
MRGGGSPTATDQELLVRVRAGDSDAYGELWRRHSGAVTAILRLETRLDADDLTAEVFTRILGTIRAGNGPDTAFRPYALVAARNLAAEWGRRGRREIAVAEESLDAEADSPPVDESAVVLPHRHVTARVFASLPVRWQEVLWYLEVEQLSATEAAPLVGLNANSTVQLAFRAREGFRQAWIQEHLVARPGGTRDCAWVDRRVGRYVRGKLAVIERGKLERHAAACERCSALIEEGRSVESSSIFSVLTALILGGAAPAYVAAATKGQARRSESKLPGEAVVGRARLAKRRTSRIGVHRVTGRTAGRRVSRPVTATLSVAGFAGAVAAVVIGIVVAQSSVEPVEIARAADQPTLDGLRDERGVPTVARSATTGPLLPDPLGAVVPHADADRAIAPEAQEATPAPAPAATAFVAAVSSVSAMPEGSAYPHVVGFGIPDASIELLVDQSGAAISLSGTADSSGAFKIDAIAPGLLGDQWAVVRQVVDGIASEWSPPFKIVIPAPPMGVWAWTAPGKFAITTTAVLALNDVEVSIDGLVVDTFIPNAVSGETFHFVTSASSPVVTIRYATGSDQSPITLVPQQP